MAMLPVRDSGDARGEMDRLFAEMPGVPAALVLMVATRGRLGPVGPRDDPSHAADGATGAPGTTPNLASGPVLPRNRRRGGRHERAGQVEGAAPARTEDPHERRRTGTSPWSTAPKR